MNKAAGVLWTTLALSGCALSAEDSFIGKARLDNCDAAVPVCSTTAGCRLGEDENYAQIKMPGYRSFVVNTEGEADLIFHFLWKKQIHPGKDVELTAFEPGCAEPHRFETTGEEMFRQIGQDRSWEVKVTVFQPGDHLVEMRMDAQGDFLFKVEVVTPLERNAPRNTEEAPEPDLPGFP
jgi:hypothetical protein